MSYLCDKKKTMEEIWKDKKDYEGLYQVSNWGRAKSLDRYIKGKGHSLQFKKGRILKPMKDNNGYLKVRLCNGEKSKTFNLHRLVAEAFLPNPDNLPQVNHKDENKLNNSVDNLEWCDSRYNKNYGTRNKRISEKMTNGKLSKPVLQYDLEGNFIKEWKSTMECGRNGFSQSAVAACCLGKLKKYKNFIWKYK